MPLNRDTALYLALGASIVVHVLGAGAAAAFRRPRAEPPGVVHEDRVELEWLELAPEAVVPDVPSEAPGESPSDQRLGAQTVTSQAPPGVTAAVTGEVLTVETPMGDTQVAPSQPEPSPVAPPRPDLPRVLDPRAVALGALDVAPRQVAPQAQPRPVDPTARYRRAEVMLDEHLTAQAATRPAVTERPRPQVRRQPDGSFRYAGHAFSASIDTNGQVHFEERAAMNYAGGGDQASSASVAFGFDLTDGAYRRHGQDPYQAERAWFMRETETMRQELQDAARERERVSLARRMAGRAQSTWDTAERSPEARRRRIFGLWDDCAENDADGDAARSAILGWVRRHLPSDSEHAFTAAELSALNARRQSSSAFAPYGGGG